MSRRSTLAAATGLTAALIVALPLVAHADARGADDSHESAGYAARIHFTKHVVDPKNLVFEGTVTGAAHGSLRSNLIASIGSTGDYSVVGFRWAVTANAHSFVAETTGTLDNATGAVSMSGTVVSGWNVGAKVLELGQGDGKGNFEGDLVLLLPNR